MGAVLTPVRAILQGVRRNRSGVCTFTLSVRPNPSLKRSANGRPPSPGWWYAVHFHQPGLGVLPLSPA